jgi:two-component system sensor histidine kinase UhpB
VLEIVQRIRRLSHQLHPATLQLLGLAKAIGAHCREVEERYDVAVSFTPERDVDPLERDTALCLFRIAQEALRNAAVHAGARHIAVTLARVGAQIELSIADDGKGFDLDAVRRCGASLGLVTMEERASLLGGRVRIVTHPGMGTKIWVRVPVPDPAAERTPVDAGQPGATAHRATAGQP